MKDGKLKYGWYFGTGDVPTTKADQDKYVFLPAAGRRNSNNTGTINFEGSSGRGYYWSSTPNAGIADYAYSLYFDSSNVSGATSSNKRNYGCSLRCVRNK